MKNPTRVAELLAELKAQCEFPFEFAAVAELEKVCRELPQAKILDEAHQEFLGKVYPKHTDGYYKKGKPLHRAVWEFYNGEVPKGYEIHHVDFNPENNQLDNLQLVTEKEHRQIHVPKGMQIPKPLKKFVCDWCGKEYEALDNGHNHFCSQKCCNAANYNKKVERVCPVCGKKFITRKHNGARTCSRLCAAKIKKPAQILSTCIFCGKEFVATRKAKYCSKKCFRKAYYEQSKIKKVCVVCGKEFLASKNDDTKCCSGECAHALRGNGPTVERTCPICGKRFFSLKGSHRGRFCSYSCQEKYRNETHAETRQCVICGKAFQCSSRHPKLTCSKNCSMKLRWQRVHENNAEK
ncbi:MAG: HNH endonuclease [Selenomonadaceae bacterium]|nr:HNH endonuclease [Selenomonadaceae bacterium]